jgi:O-antigen ligase
VNTVAVRRLAVIPRPTAWRVFVLLLMLALASEYWNKDPLRIGPLVIPWPTFVLALVLLPFVVLRSERRLSTIVRVPAPLGPLLVFWGCCAVSIIAVTMSPGVSNPLQFVKTLLHQSLYVVFAIALVKSMTWPRLFQLIKAYYALGIAAAVLSVLQYLYGNFAAFSWLAPLRLQSFEYAVGQGLTVGFRASSFFGEASWAARYYVHFLAVAIAFWACTRRRRHLAAIALFVFAFYAANSLLGYAVLAAFLLSAAVAQMWRHNVFSLGQKQRIAIAATVYIGLVVWIAGITPRLPDLLDRSVARIGAIFQGSGAVSNRFDSVAAGLEVWKRAPILGVGLGNIDRYIVPFYKSNEWVLRSQYAADSVYVQLLAETGIVGLLGFMWFFGRLLWFRAPRGFLADAPVPVARAYVLMRFLQVDLVAQAVGMLNSGDYLNPHLWTVISIVLACKVLILRERSPRSEPSTARDHYFVPSPAL